LVLEAWSKFGKEHEYEYLLLLQLFVVVAVFGFWVTVVLFLGFMYQECSKMHDMVELEFGILRTASSKHLTTTDSYS
jgi:hypothetical protein